MNEDKPVVIVGAGALGSHLVLLARNWSCPIQLIDFDRVEQRNIASQFHTKQALRQNKAQSLQRAMQGLFGRTLAANPRRLTADNVDVLLDGARLVIDCTDNIEARGLIQGHALAAGLPCVHAALAATGDFGLIAWTEHFNPDPEDAPGQATCEDGEQLPFHGLVAAQLALIAQEYLTTARRRSVQLTAHDVLRLA